MGAAAGRVPGAGQGLTLPAGEAAGGRHQFVRLPAVAGGAGHLLVAAHNQHLSTVSAIIALNIKNRHIYPPFESVSMMDSALAPAALLP
jgi:hypothetical protein